MTFTELEISWLICFPSASLPFNCSMPVTSTGTTVTCWTRSFYCADGTVLVMCKLNDLELEKHEPVLRAICASLKLEDE